MTGSDPQQERWSELRRVFERAIDLCPEERPGFLSENCPEDLRTEVEQLLAADQPAREFFDQALLQEGSGHRDDFPEFGAGSESTSRIESLVGQKLDHYEVQAFLGEGGMGVVYRAMDTRLGRPVAIKVMRPEWNNQRESWRRFLREARATSILRHPHIVTVYELGHAIISGRPTDFIVMEYVEGRTIRQVLRGTRLPEEAVLRYAMQIAGALAAAHATGILHRDLKPGNVMIGPDGEVRVLDFGLAKLWDRHAEGSTTGAAIIGTVAYMSPEQASGKLTDPRSDIFSFGVLLYEMLTGRMAFQGDSSASILAAVLRDDPAPPRGVSARLQDVLRRCLRKDPKDRFQTAAELKLHLEDCLRRDAPRGIAPALFPRYSLLALGFAVLAVWLVHPWFDRSAPDWKPVPISSYAGIQHFPSLSPDGSHVAFVWNGEKQNNADVYVRLIGSGSPFRLTTAPEADGSPAYSPDGLTIAFQRVYPNELSEVILIPALGGSERTIFGTLAPVFSGAVAKRTLAWAPDGKWLVVAGRRSAEEPSRLFAVSTDTGESRVITSPPATWIGDMNPALSSDGNLLAFTRTRSFGESDVYLLGLSADGIPNGESKPLTFQNADVSGIAWAPDSRSVLFSSNANTVSRLWRVPLSWRVFGVALPRTGGAEELVQLGEGVAHPSISAGKNRLAYEIINVGIHIGRIQLQADRSQHGPPLAVVEEASFLESSRNEFLPEYSPDGSRVAFESNRSGTFEVWVSNASGESPTQITYSGSGSTGAVRWSPDGRKLVFGLRASKSAGVYVVNADGGAPRPLVIEKTPSQVPNWSRDGKWIYFSSPRSGTTEIWKVPTQGGKPIQVTKHGGFAAAESPDGTYLYYSKDRTLAPSLWRIPVRGGEEVQVLDSVAYGRNFAVTSKGIYVMRQPPRSVYSELGLSGNPVTLEFLDFATGAIEKVVSLRKPVFAGLTISPDERYLLYAQDAHASGEIRLVDGFR